MTTVILSVPKSIIFVALGASSSEHSKGVKVAKVIAVGVLLAVTSRCSLKLDIILSILTLLIEYH
jgi:hypothetical protein